MNRICRRKFLLTPSLARRVGFYRSGRNRVTLKGPNPIYLLAAEKCGIQIGVVHTEVSRQIAPIASANCFWLWRLARRAIAHADRRAARKARLDAMPEMRRHQPSQQRTDLARQRARERYHANIEEERARGRDKKRLQLAIRRWQRQLEEKQEIRIKA